MVTPSIPDEPLFFLDRFKPRFQTTQVTEFLKETSLINEQVQLSHFAFHFGLPLHRPASPLI